MNSYLLNKKKHNNANQRMWFPLQSHFMDASTFPKQVDQVIQDKCKNSSWAVGWCLINMVVWQQFKLFFGVGDSDCLGRRSVRQNMIRTSTNKMQLHLLRKYLHKQILNCNLFIWQKKWEVLFRYKEKLKTRYQKFQQ